MYNRQKGCLSYITSAVARVLFVFFSMMIVFSTYFTWVEYRDTSSSTDLAVKVGSVAVGYLVLLGALSPLILLLGGAFPAIRITKNGLRYRYLVVLGGLIRWNEIEEIISLKYPHGAKAIVISRRGFFLFRGLWLNAILGLIFTGEIDPIVILSEQLEERDVLLAEIQKRVTL